MTSPRALWLVPAAALALALTHALPHPGSAAAPDVSQDRARLFARLGVDRWHAAGLRGQGVKVVVIDSGLRGYRSFLGSALPRTVLARGFRADGDLEARDSQHGILCGEVIHALAPDAELLFTNWEPDRPDHFLEAVRWAREQGARVLTCSVIVPTWSDGEGGGPVHEALAKLLGRDGLCFASAGNTAQRHWSGPFRDAGDGWHEGAPARKDNHLLPRATD